MSSSFTLTFTRQHRHSTFSLLAECFEAKLEGGAMAMGEAQGGVAQVSSAVLSCVEKSLIALLRLFILLSLSDHIFERFQGQSRFVRLTRLPATRPLTDHDKDLLSVADSGGHLFAVRSDARFTQQ